MPVRVWQTSNLIFVYDITTVFSFALQTIWIYLSQHQQNLALQAQGVELRQF